MDLSKISIKKIRELIVFTALLVVALWKFDVVLGVLKTIWDIKKTQCQTQCQVLLQFSVIE